MSSGTTCVRPPRERTSARPVTAAPRPAKAYPAPYHRGRAEESALRWLFPAPGQPDKEPPAGAGQGCVTLPSCLTLRRLQGDRRQHSFDELSLRFVPGGQLQRFSQGLRRLIRHKSRWVGGDLEQDPSWFAKVDRMEVPAVQHRSDIEAEAFQFFAPRQLRLIAGRAEGNMVNGAGAHSAIHQLRLHQHIDVRSMRLAGRAETVTVALHARLPEAHLLQHSSGPLESRLTQRHAKKAADAVLGRNIAGARRFRLRSADPPYQLELHAVGVDKLQHRVLEP